MSRSTPVLALACAAALLAGCGGTSKEDKAKSQVCDARADIQKQIDQLKGQTAATATVDGVKGSLQTIQDDLKKMANAQGDLSAGRKKQVEQANQTFTSDMKAIAGDITSLSATDVRARVTTAVQSLATGYQQAFNNVDCG